MLQPRRIAQDTLLISWQWDFGAGWTKGETKRCPDAFGLGYADFCVKKYLCAQTSPEDDCCARSPEAPVFQEDEEKEEK